MAVTLPRYVAFKGDNGKFLAYAVIERHPYLTFTSDDKSSANVMHEVVPSGDNVMIRCCFNNKFWRRSPNWIWADTDSPSPSNKDCLFKPFQVDSQTVALQCLGNNNFCKRLTTEGKTSCLNAAASTMEIHARLIVFEPVLRRRLYNIQYDTDNVQIYDIQPFVLGYRKAVNRSPYNSDVTVSVEYEQRKSRSWSSSTSVTTGVQLTLTAGVPEVAQTSLTISSETSVTTEMGKTEEESTKLVDTYTVKDLPPNGSVEVTLTGTQAKCKVNFSYTQEDNLADGQVVVTHLADGVFNGVNMSSVEWHAS